MTSTTRTSTPRPRAREFEGPTANDRESRNDGRPGTRVTGCAAPYKSLWSTAQVPESGMDPASHAGHLDAGWILSRRWSAPRFTVWVTAATRVSGPGVTREGSSRGWLRWPKRHVTRRDATQSRRPDHDLSPKVAQ